jgi:hypothetical protein
VTIGIRGTSLKILTNELGIGTIFFEEGAGFIQNGQGQNVPMGQGDMVKIGPNGAIGAPENKAWSAGDEAVDYGMNPFGQQNHGANGGTGGGDGAGSSGGGGNNNQ